MDVTELPIEVGSLLDRLENVRQDLHPALRADLMEVQRRRGAGLLTEPVRRVPVLRRLAEVQRRRMAVLLRRTAAATTALALAITLMVLAAWDVSRPLGLLTAAVAMFYVEHRIEKGGSTDERDL